MKILVKSWTSSQIVTFTMLPPVISDVTIIFIPISLQDRSRLSFYQGDACNLPSDLGQFGCVLAANLVCRLPNPYQFLDRLPSLVAPGGTLVITSPYSWLEEFTPKVSLCENSSLKHFALNSDQLRQWELTRVDASAIEF